MTVFIDEQMLKGQMVDFNFDFSEFFTLYDKNLVKSNESWVMAQAPAATAPTTNQRSFGNPNMPGSLPANA